MSQTQSLADETDYKFSNGQNAKMTAALIKKHEAEVKVMLNEQHKCLTYTLCFFNVTGQLKSLQVAAEPGLHQVTLGPREVSLLIIPS